MRILTSRTFLCCFWIACVAAGCKKKDDTSSPSGPSYSVPTYYNGFSNVDHTESTTILGMLSELSTEIAKGTGSTGATVPVPLDGDHLLHLLKNTGNEFVTNASYNTSGLQIESNCLPAYQSVAESILDSLVSVSNSPNTASSGVAGVGITKDASPKRFLLTKNGVNYSQILNKTAMCALIYYQIATRLANSSNLDNSILIKSPSDTTKKYTAMEHNWDVAFGYWSVPDSFPTVSKPVKFWGSYSNQVDKGLGNNQIVMNAFVKGRAAISNKDMAAMEAQANIIISEFDVMTAGAVVQELNEIQTAYDAQDAVKTVSALSECLGFVTSMKFNTFYANRKITDAQINTLLGYFPTNLWEAQQSDFDTIRAYICQVYGFTAQQSTDL